jgi:LAO/AO transport system kinase
MSIKMILGFRPHDETTWLPDVLKTVGSEGKGVQEVGEMIARHRSHLEQSGRLNARRTQRMKNRIEEIVQDRMKVEFWNAGRTRKLSDDLDAVMNLQKTPYQVAKELINTL